MRANFKKVESFKDGGQPIFGYVMPKCWHLKFLSANCSKHKHYGEKGKNQVFVTKKFQLQKFRSTSLKALPNYKN